MSAGDSASYRKVKIGSPRNFGLVFTAAFLLVAFGPLIRGHQMRPWAIGVAGAFLVIALVAPKILQPLNLLWYRIGLLLHHVINPIVMSLIFWLTVVPVGLIMQAVGKDPLRLKLDRKAETYWIGRPEASPAKGSMARQF